MKDKTVLLIAPEFFGYSTEIEQQLKAWGAKVYRYENRPSTSFLGKVVARLFPRLLAPVSDAYYARIFERHRLESIDYLFVMRGEGLTASTMRRFSVRFPSAKKVLYLWDSFKNDKGAAKRIRHFDLASSFDLDDARADRRLRFVPLFYLNQFAEIRDLTQDIDLCFVGTMHSDRYGVLSRLLATLAGVYRTYLFLFFPSRVLYWVRRISSPQYWRASRAEFSFDSLSRKAVLNIFARSRAVIDIERQIQTGLTMRSLETLGAQRKLITTNASVREYDFYDESNIAIIDRKCPGLPSEFLDRPFRPTQAAILEKYSVQRWLRVALGLDPAPDYGPKV